MNIRDVFKRGSKFRAAALHSSDARQLSDIDVFMSLKSDARGEVFNKRPLYADLTPMLEDPRDGQSPPDYQLRRISERALREA